MGEDGAAAAAPDGTGQEDPGHRVLVFAQLRGLLDIVARDLLQPAGVPYLRLDGGCAPTPRLKPRFLPCCYARDVNCLHALEIRNDT